MKKVAFILASMLVLTISGCSEGASSVASAQVDDGAGSENVVNGVTGIRGLTQFPAVPAIPES